MPSRTAPTKRRPSLPTTRAPNPIAERKRAAKASKPLKAIFKGKYIASVGSFENCGKTLGAEDISNYVTAHGGVYERQVTRDTTHLICSIEEYKKGGPQVQAAWNLGKRKCSIVVFDWLLDCTVSRNKSCRAAAGYTLDRTIKRIRKGKTDHRSFREKFEEGIRASKELVDNRLWHVYYDHTGFEYKILMSRINFGAVTGKPLIEKYTLYLFESHAIPHLYMTGAKLSRSSRPCSYYRENCRAMEFSDAFKHFQYFFQQKTGVEWDFRLERKVPVPGGSSHPTERKFTYSPPIRGRPVGALPGGYVRPEERVVEESTTTGTGFGETSESSGGGGTSGSGSEESSGGSREDVVYDTDSDADSDEDEEGILVPGGAEQYRAYYVGGNANADTEEIDSRLAQEMAGGVEPEKDKGKGKEKESVVIDLTDD